MPYIPKQLAQSAPAVTTATTVYTTPTSTTTIVKQIAVCNTTSSLALVTINIIPNAGSNTAANRIVSTATVAPSDTNFYDLTQVMSAGGFIQVTTSVANALTFTISGVEVT
jgi:ATP-dependent protease ClpP protease subunit